MIYRTPGMCPRNSRCTKRCPWTKIVEEGLVDGPRFSQLLYVLVPGQKGVSICTGGLGLVQNDRTELGPITCAQL